MVNGGAAAGKRNGLGNAEGSERRGRYKLLQVGVRFLGMDSSNKDKIEGTLHEAKGKVKEEAGKAVGNRNLEARGEAEKAGGKVEKKVGDVKKVFGK